MYIRLVRTTPRQRNAAVMIAVATTLACLFPMVAIAATGDLTQKPGTAGCVSETGTGGACADGVALSRTASIATSPDGQNVYVVSTLSDAVAIFDRASDNSLTQKAGTAGCISENGTGGACVDGVALDGALSVAVSPDGASVYVASVASDAVAIFDRASDGTLTQKAGTAGCVSEDGTGGACADGVALDSPNSVAVSPDGANVYVISVVSGAVAVFDRAPDGTLTQKAGTAGCISETGTGGTCVDGVALDSAFGVAVSSDGASVYVASGNSNAVAIFDRASDGTLTQKAGTAGCVSEDGTGGACVDGVALGRAFGVAVSPDGASVYVASLSSDAVAVFDRTSDGSLTQKAGTAGCVTEDGTGGVCTDGVALDNVRSVMVSPDGASVYVTSTQSNAVAIFDRASDGTLSQKAGIAACVSDDGTGGACVDGVALDVAIWGAISPDGASVYVASFLDSAVAVFDRELAPPVVLLVSPDSGPALGGQTVTITGTGLTNASAVTFGGTAAASFTVDSHTSITATTPAHSAGTVDVAVTAPGGSDTAGDAYTFVVAPTIMFVTPFVGPVVGGQTVTITGTGFTNASAVTFGGISAASFVVDSDTSITATTPAHPAGGVDVVVTTPGGSGTSSAAYLFVTAPVITSVSPDAGPVTGGQTVTITGAQFTNASEVTFDGTAAASFTVDSDTSITATTPEHSAGLVKVAVTTTKGSTPASGSYMFVPALTIDDVSLAEGTGGTTNFVFTVTLIGDVAGGFTVDYATVDGSATAPADYAAATGTLTFAGTNGETQTITVPVVGDTTVESNETFSVTLANPSPGVTLGDANATGTVQNDDDATIPTLDVWALILLGVVLAALAMRAAGS